MRLEKRPMMTLMGAAALAVLAAGVAGPLHGQGLSRVLERISVDVPGLAAFVEPAPLTAGLETAVSGIGIAALDVIDVRLSPASTPSAGTRVVSGALRRTSCPAASPTTITSKTQARRTPTG